MPLIFINHSGFGQWVSCCQIQMSKCLKLIQWPVSPVGGDKN